MHTTGLKSTESPFSIPTIVKIPMPIVSNKNRDVLRIPNFRRKNNGYYRTNNNDIKRLKIHQPANRGVSNEQIAKCSAANGCCQCNDQDSEKIEFFIDGS